MSENHITVVAVAIGTVETHFFLFVIKGEPEKWLMVGYHTSLDWVE